MILKWWKEILIMTKLLGGEELDHMQKCRAREVGHVGAVDKDDKRHSQVFMSLVI